MPKAFPETTVAEKLRKAFGAVVKPIKARYEVADPTPIAPPIGFRRTPSLAEQIRDMVRSQALADAAEAAGAETFAEADDFDIPDDPLDPLSPYEADFDTPVGELLARQREDLEKLAAGGSPDIDPLAAKPTPPKPQPSPREDAAAAPPVQRGSDNAEVHQ